MRLISHDASPTSKFCHLRWSQSSADNAFSEENGRHPCWHANAPFRDQVTGRLNGYGVPIRYFAPQMPPQQPADNGHRAPVPPRPPNHVVQSNLNDLHGKLSLTIHPQAHLILHRTSGICAQQYCSLQQRPQGGTGAHRSTD